MGIREDSCECIGVGIGIHKSWKADLYDVGTVVVIFGALGLPVPLELDNSQDQVVTLSVSLVQFSWSFGPWSAPKEGDSVRRPVRLLSADVAVVSVAPPRPLDPPLHDPVHHCLFLLIIEPVVIRGAPAPVWWKEGLF